MWTLFVQKQIHTITFTGWKWNFMPNYYVFAEKDGKTSLPQLVWSRNLALMEKKKLRKKYKFKNRYRITIEKGIMENEDRL